MGKNVWTWAILGSSEGQRVVLSKRTPVTEAASWLAGELIRLNLPFLYSLGVKLIDWADDRTDDIMELPITLEEARELGWDL